MRPINLLYFPLILILVSGCSGNRESGTDDILALLPYPRQVEKTGGFFDPGADGLTGQVSGIGRTAEPVIFEQLAELSLDIYYGPGEKQADPDFWIGIPAKDPAFLSYCETAGLVLPDTLDQAPCG